MTNFDITDEVVDLEDFEPEDMQNDNIAIFAMYIAFVFLVRPVLVPLLAADALKSDFLVECICSSLALLF